MLPGGLRSPCPCAVCLTGRSERRKESGNVAGLRSRARACSCFRFGAWPSVSSAPPSVQRPFLLTPRDVWVVYSSPFIPQGFYSTHMVRSKVREKCSSICIKNRTTIFLVTVPLLGQMHIPKLLNQPLAFCASHHFLRRKRRTCCWKSKTKGKPVNTSETETAKKSALPSAQGLGSLDSEQNLGTRSEKCHSLRKKRKPQHKVSISVSDNRSQH